MASGELYFASQSAHNFIKSVFLAGSISKKKMVTHNQYFDNKIKTPISDILTGKNNYASAKSFNRKTKLKIIKLTIWFSDCNFSGRRHPNRPGNSSVAKNGHKSERRFPEIQIMEYCRADATSRTANLKISLFQQLCHLRNRRQANWIVSLL